MMEPRIIVKLFAILSLTIFVGAQDGDKPNIIIFVADDLGYGDLSCYGHPSQVAGGIDELALNGKRFTAAYVPDPNGVASRGALLTGRLPVRIGLYGLDGEDRHVFTATHTTGLPKKEITIAEILRDNGYSTGMVGKWNLGINEYNPTDGAHLPKYHGFDYVGYNLPLTNSWECGERHDVNDDVKSRNCFLYKDDAIVEQPFDPMDLTNKFLKDAQKFIQDNQRDPFFLYFGFSNNHVSVSHSDSFWNTSPLGLYGDSTNEMNYAVGNLVDLVEDLGLKENTLVIFLSDNGPYLEMCSEAGYEGALRGGKSTGFEGGIRVPFIASWPGKIPTGSVSRHAVSSMDIFPTIVDVIGDALPEDVTYDGISIKDIFYEDLTAVEEWGFEIPSQIDPPHPEGLFFYVGDMLTAMRFDKYKVHFQLPPNPLKTRAEFGAECVEGVPMRSYYEGCRVPDCFQAPPVPIVYLIDEDVGEGFRFTNHSDVEVLDPGFRLKMLDLHMWHVTSVIRGPDLLSFSNQNLPSSANFKVAIFATTLLFSLIALIFSN